MRVYLVQHGDHTFRHSDVDAFAFLINLRHINACNSPQHIFAIRYRSSLSMRQIA